MDSERCIPYTSHPDYRAMFQVPEKSWRAPYSIHQSQNVFLHGYTLHRFCFECKIRLVLPIIHYVTRSNSSRSKLRPHEEIFAYPEPRMAEDDGWRHMDLSLIGIIMYYVLDVSFLPQLLFRRAALYNGSGKCPRYQSGWKCSPPNNVLWWPILMAGEVFK